MNATADSIIDRRRDFVLLFDVKNGNPNGDPDLGNAPRTDLETGHGLVTDVCLKRKVRDYVTLVTTDHQSGEVAPGYRVYVQHRGILQRFHEEAYTAEGLDPKEKKKEKKLSNAERARAWMCQTFFDVRTFGAVLTLDINCGQVRGPVQITFARSIDPITYSEQSIVRKAVATQREADEQIGKHSQVTGTMGDKQIVPYGLYRAHGFISSHLAADTGFSERDLDLLWEALINLFEHDRSAARGEMATQKLVVFEHDSPLGNYPAHKLFERVRVSRNQGGADNGKEPPRGISDYVVDVDESDLPNGVRINVML